MNKCRLGLLLSVFIVPNICAGSFLTAQKFPTTFQDLSFTERVDVIKEGYEPYKSEYDSDGRCIKNCAYIGITIRDELTQSEIDTQNALLNSAKYELNKQTQQTQKSSVDANIIISAVGGTAMGTQSTNCSNRNYNIKAGQSAPWGEPVVGLPRISSPFGERYIEGRYSNHKGIDYAVPVGTSVYTTANGRVLNVWHESGGCGNGVKIQHEDGTIAIYCHLSTALVNIGDTVYAGCAIAQSGNTGHSTGPHLHYGLLDSKGNYINPSKYTGRNNSTTSNSGAASYTFSL